MKISRHILADQLMRYLENRISLAELVSWAEDAMMDGAIADDDVVRDGIARLGLADVAAFGLTWEEIRTILASLGYRPKLAFEPV